MKYVIGEKVTLLNGLVALVIGIDIKKKTYTVICGNLEFKVNEKSIKNE
jgi:hypothetical protein